MTLKKIQNTEMASDPPCHTTSTCRSMSCAGRHMKANLYIQIGPRRFMVPKKLCIQNLDYPYSLELTKGLIQLASSVNCRMMSLLCSENTPPPIWERNDSKNTLRINLPTSFQSGSIWSDNLLLEWIREV